jgi:hypothetical protein
MWIFAIASNAPFIILPFAGWRAFRDYRRRIRVNAPAANPSATSGSNGPAIS